MKNYMVRVIEGPFIGHYSVSHIFTKRGAGKRCQQKELGRGDIQYFCELYCFFKSSGRVFVKTINEHSVDIDAAGMDILYGIDDVCGGLLFVHFHEAFRINRLKTDKKSMAARLFHQIKKLLIACDLNAYLGRPFKKEILLYHGPEKFFGSPGVCRKMVIIEKNHLAKVPVCPKLFHDMLCRTVPELSAEHAGH